jgi:signal transduction histidine kinase
MSTGNAKTADWPPREQLVIRAVRHEVGDFLQSVYAAAALLTSRLPPEAELERRLIAELRGRAEGVRQMLDGLHTLLVPEPLQPEPVDLSAVVRETVSQAERFVPRQVKLVETTGTLPVLLDTRRLREGLLLLLLAAGRYARSVITVRCSVGAAETVQVAIEHDGSPPTEAQRQWLNEVLPTTHDLLIGLALAIGQDLAATLGGRFAIEELPEGGTRFCLTVPAAPAPPKDLAS